MKKLFLMLALVAMFFVACKEEEQTQTETGPDKKGGREVVLSTIVQQDSTIHMTTQKIWMNGQIVKTETTSFKTINPPIVKDTVDDNGTPKVIEHSSKLPIFVQQPWHHATRKRNGTKMSNRST